MKKRFIPLLALLLSLCILVPVSIAQSAAEGAVQISVTAAGGSVEIDDHAVADGKCNCLHKGSSAGRLCV